MQKNALFILFLLLFSVTLVAQHQEIHTPPHLWKGKKSVAEDSTSLLFAFKHGKVHGNLRYFFMATENDGHLTDSYAHAAGGGLFYETGSFKGFQMGVGGYFIYNIASSDMSKIDPYTQTSSRYETSLFDLEDLTNKNDLDRLEELYLKYNFKKSHITAGKQLINTPFINLQDGRMRPTEVGGLYGEIFPGKKNKLEGGYLYEISPRGTVNWYGIGESIGIYPNGTNVNGTKGNYKGHIESNGVYLVGYTHQLPQGNSLKLWNVYVDNVFNTSMLQWDLKRGAWVAGVQYTQQEAVNEGGNEDPSKTYFSTDQHSRVISTKVGYESGNWKTSLNYTRITAEGRYLMPREWGRDPFYTFMPRERNEGFGDVNAYVGKVNYAFSKTPLKASVSYGYFQLPDVKNYALNKYGLPSYTQLNLDLTYEFTDFLEGLDIQALYVHKANQGETYQNEKYIINKVNMSNYNLIFNFHF
ncbi:OprD family outer membrane porin [Aquirufa lenticrescens]